MRSNDLKLLHPAMRLASVELGHNLAREKIPLAVYEGVRHPRRQADLYFVGRVPGFGTPGRYKTFSKPWVGRHQYGLATDWTFMVNGNWTWEEPEDGMWERFHKIARNLELEILDFEKGHVQLPGLSTKALRAGEFPPMGDDRWESHLTTMMREWGPENRLEHGITLPGAPLVYEVDVERPDLVAPPGLVYDEERGMCVPESALGLPELFR